MALDTCGVVLRSRKFNRQEGREKKEERNSLVQRQSRASKAERRDPMCQGYQPVLWGAWRRQCLICTGLRGLVWPGMSFTYPRKKMALPPYPFNTQMQGTLMFYAQHIDITCYIISLLNLAASCKSTSNYICLMFTIRAYANISLVILIIWNLFPSTFFRKCLWKQQFPEFLNVNKSFTLVFVFNGQFE